ncbi:hypothetical protein EUTSA_v10027233mg [Eutrema salsugineum]|uniref:UBX domain-containing protein n=1 Tax=Eutrema salsugineum TaxID=72664 RepID=V4ML15_EUTSA|nr:hypothetical protein EUTSA_v10027233mg [Eutrema salsugineum]
MGATFSRANKQRVITTRSQLDKEINLFLNKEPYPALSMDERYDKLISSFLEIAVGQTVETATRFLETTNWNIEEAINLFLFDNNYDPSMYHDSARARTSDDTSESDDSTTSDEQELDSRLSSRPPPNLLFEGSFQEAKSTSSEENLWLIVNLQSRKEFASHTLNRDLWSNEAVSETVEAGFMLWQVYDHTIEGQKFSGFYRIGCAPPVVLVIDPITGQKMRMWSGEIEAQSFVEDLSRFMEANIGFSSNKNDQAPAPSWVEEFEKEDTCSSSNHINQVAGSSGEDFQKDNTWSSSNIIQQTVASSCVEEFENMEPWSSNNNYDHIVTPSWEPEFEDSSEVEEEESRILLCSLCVRFPDGRRKQRRFLKSEPVQLLWSFCYSQMEESEKKAFKLVQAIPGASKTLDYGANTTFDQSGLS